jgi:hypothetical protein
MAKSSAHFSSTGGDDSHNERVGDVPDYVQSILDRNLDLEKNLTASLERNKIAGRYFKTFSEVKEFIKSDYQENSYRGRGINKTTKIFREAVINLNDNHTTADIVKLGKMLKKEFGISTLSAHIHNDEGYIDRHGEFIRNKHLQIQTTWYQFGEGKFWKPKKKDLSNLQTRIAEVLGMERGTTWEERAELGVPKSNRLNQNQYRYIKRKENLDEWYQEAGKQLSEEDETKYLRGAIQNDEACKILGIYEPKLDDKGTLAENTAECTTEEIKTLKSHSQQSETVELETRQSVKPESTKTKPSKRRRNR